jgi:alkaline phosphatase
VRRSSPRSATPASAAAAAALLTAAVLAGCDALDGPGAGDAAADRDASAGADVTDVPVADGRDGSSPACRLPPDALGRLDTLATEGGDDEPVRVILVVGDGVGAGYWTAARLARTELAAFRLPVVGFTDSRNAGGRVTDSAASATALASGCLTYSGSIGMGPDTTALATVTQAARRRGLSVGLVTTSRVTHATPAAFAAHVVDRDEEEQIALQMADFGPDVLLGGGRELFRAEDREDGQDLLGRLRKGRTYVETAAGLDSVAADGPPTGLVGLFADRDLPPAPEREVSPAAMTRAALETLDRDPDGFFLVVEAAQPDWRGHSAEDLEAVQAEMLGLDDAVRAARDYREERPGTLLVVASDHETGGLAVVQDGDRLREAWASAGEVSVADHTANLVPHFAAGPGAEALRGIHTPASLGRRLMTAVGGEELAEELSAVDGARAVGEAGPR